MTVLHSILVCYFAARRGHKGSLGNTGGNLRSLSTEKMSMPIRQVIKGGIVVRIKINYIPRNACSTSIGVDPAVAEKCPHAMLETVYPGYFTNDDEAGANEERGPNASQIKAINDLRLIWQEFFGRNGKLHREVQKKYCRGCELVFGHLMIPIQIPLMVACLPLCCSMRAKRINKWNDAMVKFVDELNQKLQPFGFFVKTQSNCVIKEGKERLIPNTFFIQITWRIIKTIFLNTQEPLTNIIKNLHTTNLIDGLLSH